MADIPAASHARIIRVIIPALNEENAIAAVLKAIPPWVKETLVVDNGSTDGTARVARESGARVVGEKRRGYGSACLRGIAELPRDTEVTVFMDGDYSDYPEEMAELVGPILAGEADLVIGSRVLGRRAGRVGTGALMPVAVFGNWLSTRLVRWGWGFAYTDLGPFRAIRHSSLLALDMRDADFGWTVEMQVKAVNLGLRVMEIPVSYRKRIGQSKISGTILGSWRAGWKILSIIAREWAAKAAKRGQDRQGRRR
jgi:glycosyltransferase involved in cell wall biosynthesis